MVRRKPASFGGARAPASCNFGGQVTLVDGGQGNVLVLGLVSSVTVVAVEALGQWGQFLGIVFRDVLGRRHPVLPWLQVASPLGDVSVGSARVPLPPGRTAPGSAV